MHILGEAEKKEVHSFAKEIVLYKHTMAQLISWVPDEMDKCDSFGKKPYIDKELSSLYSLSHNIT